MTLRFQGAIDVPPGQPGGFDHADVHEPSGRVFVAHTAFGEVSILDGAQRQHVGNAPGCPEASGVLCTADASWIFAAARGAGRILVLEAPSGEVVRTLAVGAQPNGLAWDENRRHLLVADVADAHGHLVDPESGHILASVALPGRPRWAAHDPRGDRFLVNIADPPQVAVLAAHRGDLIGSMPIRHVGPHGMALDQDDGQIFVACDSGDLVVLDRATGAEITSISIAGAPDVLWFNPPRHFLYVAIGDPGLIQVIDTKTMTHVEEIRTEKGAHTLTFDVSRQLLYVFLPQSSRAAVFAET